MSLRTKLNERPAITGGVAVTIILVAAWTAYSLSRPTYVANDAYYTTDDGATWFAAGVDEVPPFPHDGKPAVRAHVFTGADGEPFVGYLERYSDDAKAVIDQARAAKATGGPMPPIAKIQAAGTGGRLVKKPGAREWVNANDTGRAMKVMNVAQAAGKAAQPKG